MTINDGGAAFPMATIDGYTQDGMTLRDYFAAHATQPGISEICAAAGIKLNPRLNRVWLPDDPSDGPGIIFDVWFNDLPLGEKMDIFATVKFAEADAMLKARQPK